MPCVAVARLISDWCACLDGVSMARDGRGCGAAHGQKALDAGARCVGAAGGAREQRTRGRAAGVAQSRATGSRAVAPGPEVVEGARAAGGTRFAAMRA